MRRNILIVAEHAETREALAVLLRSEGLTVSLTPGAADAVRVLRSCTVDTALLVSPGPDPGAEKLRARILQESPRCRVLTLVRTVRLKDRKRETRFSLANSLVGERELLALLASAHDEGSEETETTLPDKGVRSLVDVVDVLVGLLELGDRHFAGSSHRAMQLASTVAEEMRLPEEQVTEVVLAALLRDIGKYGLHDSIYQESGRLSEEQTVQMREHVSGGLRLLEHIEFPWKILAVIRHHHERYDGLGYPDGLRGPEIPLGARILAVVDSYVAMLSERPHRQPLSSEEALRELERHAGFQFDPEVLEVFIRAVHERHRPLSADQRPRVFISDHDSDFVRPLEVRLRNEGLEVETETNIQEALLRMLESPPHLILAALDSDESRSVEFLRLLRADDTLGRIPFVFLLNRFDLAQNVKILRQGVDDCLIKTDELELIVARIRNILVRETRRHSTGEEPHKRGISGQLENLSLPDICQMLNLGLKTACLTLSSGEDRGRIWFEQGTTVHAELDAETGTDAFNRMLRWKTGEFTIEHGLKSETTSLEGDTMFLVMEGLRLMDEASMTTAETVAD